MKSWRRWIGDDERERGAGDGGACRLAGVSELNGAYDGMPIGASLPHATIALGPESDWSWKGGAGREIRLTATVRDAGERPVRLRGLLAAVEATLVGLGGAAEGWLIVNVVTLRTRMAQRRAGEWTGVVEVRVPMELVA